ncbi:hypothetical protein [Clostridium butyricum]|uniref:hypothetical protein n=1 Tax=Clostridium butyricum TaxID=1492 RepID=UPI00374EC6B6
MLKEKVIESIENTDKIIRVPKIEIKDTEINKIILSEKNTLNVNLKEILETKVVISNYKREVLGMRLEKLPDKKCIILSATANERIYRSLLADREIKYVDIGEIETIGKLALHYSAFSRISLKNDFDRRIEQINKEANGISNVITFAKYEEYFKEAGFNVIAHFGACSGLDGYKGEDLIVAGTPHVDERVYLLLAAIIDETMEVKQNLEYRNVRRNGFEFYFNTYDEGRLLQEIQFYYIESELIQAVGRARILRTEATVHLFSNYPLKGAILYNE